MSKISPTGRMVETNPTERVAQTIDKTSRRISGEGLAVTDSPHGTATGLTELPVRMVQVVTNKTGGIYSVKQINQGGDDMERPLFWAEHVNGDDGLAVDTKGFAVYGTEGRWGFFTEQRQLVRFAGSCMLDKANDAAPTPDVVSFTNTANAGPGNPLTPVAASEQRLAIKFDAPVTPAGGSTWTFPVGLQDIIKWEVQNDPTSADLTWGGYIWFITVDFDYTGVGCATWNSLNCVSQGVAGYPSADTMAPGDAVSGWYHHQTNGDGLTGNLVLRLKTAPATAGDNPHAIAIREPLTADTEVFGLMVYADDWSAPGGVNLISANHTTTYTGISPDGLIGVHSG